MAPGGDLRLVPPSPLESSTRATGVSSQFAALRPAFTLGPLPRDVLTAVSSKTREHEHPGIQTSNFHVRLGVAMGRGGARAGSGPGKLARLSRLSCPDAGLRFIKFMS